MKGVKLKEMCVEVSQLQYFIIIFSEDIQIRTCNCIDLTSNILSLTLIAELIIFYDHPNTTGSKMPEHPSHNKHIKILHVFMHPLKCCKNLTNITRD